MAGPQMIRKDPWGHATPGPPGQASLTDGLESDSTSFHDVTLKLAGGIFYSPSCTDPIPFWESDSKRIAN